MPENFPTWDEESRTLGQTEYFTLPEIAEMFHVSESAARRWITELGWPHLHIGRRLYMTMDDIATALREMRSEGIPTWRGQPGVPVPEDPAPVDPAADAGEGFR
jgi:hypothetical protein